MNVKEATELRQEADQGFTAAHAVKTGMPEWVTTLRFNGDFRGRYEGFFADPPQFVDRNRFRYRARFGFTAVMLDQFEVGLRLGSGDIDSANRLTTGTDPISQNQSFQNNAAKKGIFLDLAYARWTPLYKGDWSAALTIGKMENPFVLSEMLFDRDYTPEGAGQQIGYAFNDVHSLKLNAGQFILDELGGDSDDPFLLGAQLRFDSKWTPKISSSVGFGWLAIFNDESLASDSVPDINTGNLRVVRLSADGKSYTLGAPVYGFNTLVADASISYSFESLPGYSGAFPLRVFGDYVHNTSAPEARRGYQAGVALGKAGKRRTWEIVYTWRTLDGDAWWEELPESDFGGFYGSASLTPPPAALRAPGTGYGSGTNVRGHIVRGSYSPYDSLTLTVSWFSSEIIEEVPPGSDSQMDRLQVDAVWKF